MTVMGQEGEVGRCVETVMVLRMAVPGDKVARSGYA